MSDKPVEVRPVDSRAEFRRFIALPRQLYEGMPGFSPPLDLERAELFDKRRNPFFTHGRAQYWLAWRGSEAVGRISAQIDDLHATVGRPDLGMFGAFDAIDDPAVTGALLRVANHWLASAGKRVVRGPFNLSISAESGLLVDGREQPPMVLFPWHPAYLGAHLEAHGFAKAHDLLSFYLSREELAAGRIPVSRLNQALPSGYRLRAIDFSRGPDELVRLGAIYNTAWVDNWGFVPLTEADIAGMYKSMRPFLNKDSGVVVEYEGEPVAFSVTIPNISDYCKGFGGRMTPLNAVRFGWRIINRRFNAVRNVLFGILPAHQGGSIGAAINLALLHHFRSKAGDYRANRLELGWIVEDNRRTLALIKFFGARPSRRFRIFETRLASATQAVEDANENITPHSDQPRSRLLE